MTSAAAVIATVESNHTIKVPASLPVGEQVLVMQIPSIATLLSDAARRDRFAATRRAIQSAIKTHSLAPSNQEIVRLVKCAGQATRDTHNLL
jgi:hypothetical protein